MKTIDQIKDELWKRFRANVINEVQLSNEDIQRLMTDGVIFIRVAVLSGGEPVAKVMSKDQVAKDPR